MNRCPITYEDCGHEAYSQKGLRKLSRGLRHLKEFPYSADEQRKQALVRAAKMSIQGIQPKLSARLRIKSEIFEVVDRGGQYILKPQHQDYAQLPENEDLTMRLARAAGIDVPLHGMTHCKDGTFTYFIKRFDRYGKGKKRAVEDFAQLAGKDRETKYGYSIERMVPLLDLCTFPSVARAHFFKRILFIYLVGNEDMHLKNFSLFTRDSNVELAPAYDFLNTTIAFLQLGAQKSKIEETALTLKGKKRNLRRNDLIDYLGRQRLDLAEKALDSILADFAGAFGTWDHLISRSFLSEELRFMYRDLLKERKEVLSH